MAIFGYTNEIVKNINFNKTIIEGLNYLQGLTPDSFSELKEGESQKIPLDGDKLFALNQIYKTKSIDQAKFEGHQRYIDLQYIFEGFEIIRNSSSIDCQSKNEYDEKNDVQFFTSNFFTPIALRTNMLCILYPEDIHAPGLIFDGPSIVKKSVIKVLI